MWPTTPGLVRVFNHEFGDFFSRIAMRGLSRYLSTSLSSSIDFLKLIKEFSVNSGQETGYCPFLGCPVGKVNLRSKRTLISRFSERALYALAFSQSVRPIQTKSHIGFYKTWFVDKGRGRRRRIDAPRECLSVVQKQILDDALNPVLLTAPEHVVCRSGSQAIDGAAMHAGSRFLVGMDIKDFYPSIETALVIERLRSLPRPARWTKIIVAYVREALELHHLWGKYGIDIQELCGRPPCCARKDFEPPAPCASGSPCEVECFFKAWLALPGNECLSHWEAVLIGRLLTWHGRLPQGAPSSPAMANLAFEWYDKQIMTGLGSRFLYSRYMDDISVSISAKNAKIQLIDNTIGMRRFVLGVVNEVLRNSRLQLNHAKTVATEAGRRGSGLAHTVTGYRVGAGIVDLPKAVKRFFRGLGQRIKAADGRLDVLATQTVLKPRETPLVCPKPSPQFDKSDSRHRYPGRVRTVESDAVAIVKMLHPKLRWEKRPGELTSQRRKTGGAWVSITVKEDPDLVNAMEIEELFSRTWKGDWEIRAESSTAVSIVDKSGNNIGTLSSAELPNFFMLDKQTAWACAAYFPWLAGHVGRLMVPPAHKETASGIQRLWEEFRPLLSLLKIGDDGGTEA